MESVRLSVQGADPWWPVVYAWMMCGLASLLWLGATYWMSNMIEKRIRVSGILSRY
jgi:hypothetical protein